MNEIILNIMLGIMMEVIKKLGGEKQEIYLLKLLLNWMLIMNILHIS